MEQFSLIQWLVNKIGLPKSLGGAYIHITTALVVLCIITAGSFVAWLKLRRPQYRLVPEAKGTLANVFEVLVEGLVRLMEDMIGKDARMHLPLLGSLFVYILVCNLMGVIPGMVPPTDNINTNAACAIVVFLYYNAVGIKKQGLLRYLKHMAGPVLWLMPLMFAVELVSHVVRPISLSVRLFGNMTGDHVVLGIFSQLVPFLVPIIFQGLAIFVAFIQAFVFTLLSTVYIALATSAEH